MSDLDAVRVQVAILEHLHRDGPLIRETLLNRVREDAGASRGEATDALDELERRGEIYVVDGEVRRP